MGSTDAVMDNNGQSMNNEDTYIHETIRMHYNMIYCTRRRYTKKFRGVAKKTLLEYHDRRKGEEERKRRENEKE